MKLVEYLEETKDALRYRYLRDVALKNQKRDDLMEPLRKYFYINENIKYPTANDYDTAIDVLMNRENSNV